MGRNIQQYDKVKYPQKTPNMNILLLDGKPRSSEVRELQYLLLLLQFTLSTTVDLGITNLVPRYTGELYVLHSGLPILLRLPIPVTHLNY